MPPAPKYVARVFRVFAFPVRHVPCTCCISREATRLVAFQVVHRGARSRIRREIAHNKRAQTFGTAPKVLRDPIRKRRTVHGLFVGARAIQVWTDRRVTTHLSSTGPSAILCSLQIALTWLRRIVLRWWPSLIRLAAGGLGASTPTGTQTLSFLGGMGSELTTRVAWCRSR